MPYDPEPRYALEGRVDEGHAALAAELAGNGTRALSIDGPAALAWEPFIGHLAASLRERGVAVRAHDVRERMLSWPEIARLTEHPVLSRDPVFAAAAEIDLAQLFGGLDVPRAASGELSIVFGPGSALARHDTLWYADLPKRLALAACDIGRARNLGQPSGGIGTARRLMFVDWPIEDRHRRRLSERWTRYIDASDGGRPRSCDAGALRRALRALVAAPFRTRPSFLAQPWGGTWSRDVLGVREGEPNGGLGYELVAPESGVLFQGGASLEVALDVLVAAEPERLLGGHVLERFGASLPIRFDYLDTMGGGDLSVHCHPRAAYMRDVFGLPYAQDETYYVMVTRPGARIFLGLREGTDVEQFRAAAARAQGETAALDVERFVAAFPAHPHQLYLIPAGTPHGSGEGNVVLEISATPYLYSLRFYDWQRQGLDGAPRPVQLEHAFANLDPARAEPHVARDLVPQPRALRRGRGFSETVIGSHPALFFEVHRLELDGGRVTDATEDRFHVLNLVEGDDVLIRTSSGQEHPLAYAETLVVPAAVGEYRVASAGVARLVKAFVA